MFRVFTVVVEIPALDRFVDFLQSTQQKEIDGLTVIVAGLTDRLQKSQNKLQSQINQEKS